MNWSTVASTAFNSLSANRVRTWLTSLGITIGIAAVIAMVSAGRGAQSRIDEAFRSLGPNMVMAFSGQNSSTGLRIGADGGGTFTRIDAQVIRTQLARFITGCSEMSQFPAEATSPVATHKTTYSGSTPDLFRMRRWELRSYPTGPRGRLYTDAEVNSEQTVAVLGSTVADKLFPRQNPVGHTIRTREGNVFRIIGVLASKGGSLAGGDQDDIIMIPISTLLRRVSGKDKCMFLMAEARSAELTATVKERMEAILRKQHHVRPGEEPNFYVNTMQEFSSIAGFLTATLSGLVFTIACVSLVVGGIGVMNIMLVSVTERTREIGIRMAVGARTRDILGQFLTEATMLALLGGLVGITLGSAIAWVIAWIADWDFIVTPESVLAAVMTSAVVGVFFGFYPARKASLLDPIECLRYE